jgi:sugar transferase (PEP-CTERM/EpsH1 system associated)
VTVLFLTHRLPYAPNRGDRIRAYYLLKELSRRADVHVVSLVHDAEEAAQVEGLKTCCASVVAVRVPRMWNVIRSGLALPTRRPTTHTMLDSPGLQPAIQQVVAAAAPDVVLAYCSGMARVALHDPLRTIPFVLDMVDVDSAKWEGLARTASFPQSWIYAREARCLSRFEARAARAAYASIVVTDKERNTLVGLAPDARVEVIGNGVDTDALAPRNAATSAPVVVFCGVMNYGPNEEGARWLATRVWPEVLRRRPDARLQLVGSSPSGSVRALASPTIEVTGAVADVKPYLWNAAVGTAPLLTARGVQNKVLEAVAAGLPTVVTPIVDDGLPSEIRPGCSVAGTPQEFADAIVSFLDMPPDERRRRAAGADVASLSWAGRLAPFERILAEAAGSSRTRPMQQHGRSPVR